MISYQSLLLSTIVLNDAQDSAYQFYQSKCEEESTKKYTEKKT